jgi:hypothetical protein
MSVSGCGMWCRSGPCGSALRPFEIHASAAATISSVQQRFHRVFSDRRRNRFFASASGCAVSNDIGLSGHAYLERAQKADYLVCRATKAIGEISSTVVASVATVPETAAYRLDRLGQASAGLGVADKAKPAKIAFRAIFGCLALGWKPTGQCPDGVDDPGRRLPGDQLRPCL